MRRGPLGPSEFRYSSVDQINQHNGRALSFTSHVDRTVSGSIGEDHATLRMAIAVDGNVVIDETFQPFTGQRTFNGEYEGIALVATCVTNGTDGLATQVYCRMSLDGQPGVTLANIIPEPEVPNNVPPPIAAKPTAQPVSTTY